MFNGCVTYIPKNEIPKGYATWNYKSQLGSIDEHDAKRLSIAVNIKDLTNQNSDFKGSGIGVVLAFFPVVSLLTPSSIRTNHVIGCADEGALTVKKGDVERIFVDELRKSKLFTSVEYSKESSDYKIMGKIDFIEEDKLHFSGFGGLLFCVIPFLPTTTVTLSINSHLELVSSNGLRTLLSKDYKSEIEYQFNPNSYNNNRQCTAYGEELLPQIISEFIRDINEIPSTTWGVSQIKKQETPKQSINETPVLNDLRTQLEDLEKMKASGMITEEEYKKLKTKIINKY